MSKPPDLFTDPYATKARAARRTMGLLGASLPGDRLKTAVYLSLIAKPRKLLRQLATAFYRFDHPYAVLREFTGVCAGPLSILEFGTAQGYSTKKLLYATRYLGVEDRVTVHGFDSFEGLPEAHNPEDLGFRSNDWIPGSYRASYETLRQHLEHAGYRNFRLHAGYFEHTLTEQLLAELREAQPILVWVDCDLYTSSRTVMERLIPILPNGCVIYFDDLEFNCGSRLTGQARLVHEINAGMLGPGLELVPDRELSWDSNRIYRFFREGEAVVRYRPLYRRETPPLARPIGDGSPLP